MVGHKDVSALLRQFKLPLLPIGKSEIRVADLPEATRIKLVDEGLLMPAGTNDKGRQQYAVAWVAKTSAVRQETFPPTGRSWSSTGIVRASAPVPTRSCGRHSPQQVAGA